MATTAGYGRWDSPIAAADVARAKVSLSDLSSDGDALYWLESRPAEAGRVVMVRTGADGLTDHSPPEVSIRSRVHEYGGAAVCIVPGREPGAFAYVDQADQRVWFCDGAGVPGQAGSATPRALTAAPPEGEVHNHGGLSATADGDWILAVREVHRHGVARPERSVVALATRSAEPGPCTLVEGHDFYGQPRVDATGARLAVVAWDHPDMSWDASVVLVARLRQRPGPGGPTLEAEGTPWTVAGGPGESVGQPRWAGDGTLRFVSDRDGWWQPYAHPGVPGVPGETGEKAHASKLSELEAEFHGPDWVLGQSTMAELADGILVARVTAAGRDALVRIPPGTPASTPPERLEQPCVSVSAVCAHREGVAVIGTTPQAPSNVWLCAPGAVPRPLRPPPAKVLAQRDVAHGEAFALRGRSGRPVHATLYRPALGGTQGRAGTLPPLVTWCHGGPTSSCQPGLDLTLQFFTTRGFAVACVDYAGSAGYGRAYRCALWGQWGVADAEDCLDAALQLAARGDVDPQRMAVRGGSAGGMTALNALASGEGFAACASWYGVTDLIGLVATTHDFEAHYTDRLIGPLPRDERLYEERSPLRRAAAMDGAVLLLQGTEDPIVPPAQAESMRDALDAVGTRCDLRFFEGEAHGFRRADTLTACLEAELGFYLEELRL